MSSQENAGTVVEFDVDDRLGYAIATCFLDEFGHVLHVLKGTYAERPRTLEFLVNSEVLVVVCFPLNAARGRKIVRGVGSVPLRGKIPWLPAFRTPLNMASGDKGALWNGRVQSPTDRLSEEQARSMPVLRVVNDTFIVHVLKTGIVPAPALSLPRRD